MKKLLAFFIAICLYAITTNAQDTIIIKHDAYTSVFSNLGHIPVLVWYQLDSSDLACKHPVKRINDFKQDPDVQGTDLKKDYEGSGYDQGHNMSAEDNICDINDMHECFYYTNMIPQLPALNRGIWKSLENHERQLAKENETIVVFIGSYGQDKTIGPDKVIVPAYCWKVIYVPKTEKWYEYIFPNKGCEGSFDQYQEFTKDQEQWEEYLIHKFTGY